MSGETQTYSNTEFPRHSRGSTYANLDSLTHVTSITNSQPLFVACESRFPPVLLCRFCLHAALTHLNREHNGRSNVRSVKPQYHWGELSLFKSRNRCPQYKIYLVKNRIYLVQNLTILDHFEGRGEVSPVHFGQVVVGHDQAPKMS